MNHNILVIGGLTAIGAALVYMSWQHKQQAAVNTAANAVDTASAYAIYGQNIEATNIPTGGELPITEIPQDTAQPPVQTNALIIAASKTIAGT